MMDLVECNPAFARHLGSYRQSKAAGITEAHSRLDLYNILCTRGSPFGPEIVLDVADP